MTAQASQGGPTTVYEAFAAVAHRRADQPAILFEDGSVSYAQLLRRIDGAAARLAASGIGRGDAFAVFSHNRPEIMHAYYAAARLGAVLVPINPAMSAAEVAHAVAHSGARLLFHDALSSEAAHAAFPGQGCRPLDTLAGDEADGDAAAAVLPDDDLLICYTSGSTGVPKAIALSHAAQLGAADALREMWGVTEADVTLVALPMGYLYGLSTASAVTLQSGGTIAILPRFRPGDVLDAFAATGATLFQGVPTMFAMMLDYAEQRGLRYDLSGVRTLVCAGAPLPDALKARFARRFGKGIENYYAMTECTPVFGVYASDRRPVPAAAIGRAAPGATVRIVAADGTECALGVPGELLVRGAATMSRYHGDPAMTASAMVDGLFRSGDVGVRDADGFFYITGRIKDLIIRGGANIAPAEVEAVIARHPAVLDVAVVGAPDRIFGEVPVAHVVLRAGAAASADELMAHAGLELAAFKVPTRFRFGAELPLGKTGKVDKAALKANWPMDDG